MTIAQAIEKLKCYESGMSCALALWLPDDVRQVAEEEHFGLTDDQVTEVLYMVEHHHDATIGINWDVIREHVRDVIAMAKKESEANQRAVTWDEKEE